MMRMFSTILLLLELIGMLKMIVSEAVKRVKGKPGKGSSEPVSENKV